MHNRFTAFTRRFVAYTVDLLVLAVPAGGAFKVLISIGASGRVLSTVGIAFTVASLVYLVVLEGGPRGATVGKRLMRLRVVGLDGEPIGYARAAVRTLGRLVSTLPLYAGFLWCLVDRRGRTWHDMLARSIVLVDGRAPTAATAAR